MIQIYCVAWFSFVYFTNSFLLDSNTTTGSSGQLVTNQYLSIQDFLNAKKQLQNGMESIQLETQQLRHDMDNTLNILSSQLQNRLAIFERKIDTNESRVLEQKYSKLLDKFVNIQHQYTIQEDELIQLRNLTSQLTDEIRELRKLKNIQGLHDMYTLKEDVKAVISETNQLRVNQRARSQDFLALYNVTLASKGIISDLQKQTKELRDNQNVTSAFVSKTIHELNVNQNITIETKIQELLTQMKNGLGNTKQIALTACVDKSGSGIKPPGHTVNFNDVRSFLGVDSSSISKFKSSGIFTSDIHGIYLITAWILSSTPSGEFGIYKYGFLLGRVFISNDNQPNTGTATVAVELKPGDSVWVQINPYPLHVYTFEGQESCVTIMKVI